MKSGQVTATANAEINGEAMRRRRIIAGLSVKGLADKVGCSRPYISILETKPGRSCSPELFARICRALRVEQAEREQLLRTRATSVDAREVA